MVYRSFRLVGRPGRSCFSRLAKHKVKFSVNWLAFTSSLTSRLPEDELPVNIEPGQRSLAQIRIEVDPLPQIPRKPQQLCAFRKLESSASVRHFDLDGYEKIDQALVQSNNAVIASLQLCVLNQSITIVTTLRETTLRSWSSVDNCLGAHDKGLQTGISRIITINKRIK
jgi:hypothetical protein